MTDSSASQRRELEERFLELLEPNRVRLSRYCRAMAVDRDQAKDLMSETIFLAFQSFQKLKDHGRFQSYLFTIATRLHSKERSRTKRFERFTAKSLEIPSHGTSPEMTLDVEILYKALQQIPEKQREAIVLFEISGLSIEEVREIQGGSLSGVKSRLARGREALQRLMGVRERVSRREPAAKPVRQTSTGLAYSTQAKL